ncbi:MAG: glycosyltransferase family 10 [Patescibacteria group bacterium]
MKDILINFSSPVLGNNFIFNTNDANNLNDPWKLLKKKLFNLGYNIKTADQNGLSNCTWVLFIDGDSLGKKTERKRELYQDCLDSRLKNKMALFLWEGKSVKPHNYTKQLHDKFSIIFTWNDDLVDNKKFFKFHLPCPAGKKPVNRISFNEKKFLVNISANKLSRFPNELYSTRRKSIKFFENRLGDQFDLFGPRWNRSINRKEKFFPFLMPKFKSYKGISPDKIETFSHYKFALCYENAYGLNGYITEKIFDCFNAGIVPIYWGAENIADYVDKNTFIDRRKFKSDKELFDFLNKIDENEYNKYLSAIEKYLTGDNYKLFLSENFADTIIKTLNLKTNL